jgi:mannose-1-phosphate guanylyltransferase/mannose-6-phosphate isomerase
MIKYSLYSYELLFDALHKIEENKKGFLIILDDKDHVVGTLTDGDIRRALLSGKNLNAQIEDIYNKDFKYVYDTDEFGDVVEIFKSIKIDFLPILSHDGSLRNIITKKNMHVLIMEDREFDMNFDFLSLDDSLLEHEIYNRPWGIYKTTFLNHYAQSKIIKVNPMGELSLQEHKRREEHWVIIRGEGEVILGESVKKVSAGSFVYIPKGCKHKLINKSDTKTLMVAEVQLGDYFGEDDIIRYEDKYGRV